MYVQTTKTSRESLPWWSGFPEWWNAECRFFRYLHWQEAMEQFHQPGKGAWKRILESECPVGQHLKFAADDFQEAWIWRRPDPWQNQEYLLGKNKVKTTFVEFYDKYLEDIKAQVGAGKSIALYHKYSAARSHFVNFLHAKYGRKDLMPGELTHLIIHDLKYTWRP